jgi:hypothetical protein
LPVLIVRILFKLEARLDVRGSALLQGLDPIPVLILVVAGKSQRSDLHFGLVLVRQTSTSCSLPLHKFGHFIFDCIDAFLRGGLNQRLLQQSDYFIIAVDGERFIALLHEIFSLGRQIFGLFKFVHSFWDCYIL